MPETIVAPPMADVAGTDATIPRKVHLRDALNYGVLREQGLGHIRRLSTTLWTDHNLHDPGITILEVLCYALTDLAYRTEFATVDLLTAPDGTMDRSGLPPAHEVLPTAPRTIADYRRLLLRIEDVHNAWLDPMNDPADPGNYRQSEIAIYRDDVARTLTFNALNAGGQPNAPIALSGLYRVMVELDVDDQLGPLNESRLVYRVRRGPLKGVVLSFESRDASIGSGALDFDAVIVSATVNNVAVSPDEVTAKVPREFTAQVTLGLVGGGTVPLTQGSLAVVEDRPRPGQPALTIDAAALTTVLEDITEDGLLPLFWTKQQRRRQALDAVRSVLHANRGLCEDFLTVDTIRPYRLGVCADITVKPDADLEQVQAAVVFAIEQYLSAPVRYRTLGEMLASGSTPDEIFNGPFVDFGFTFDGKPVFSRPGFITDDDLAASELRREVRTSDIVNVVVDIDGVEAVSGISLRAYDARGKALAPSESWTLDVPPGHQPVLAFDLSKLLFLRDGIPYRARDGEFTRTLDQLRETARRKLYVAPDQVLPTPRGRWRHLDSYVSIQHELPANYKVGVARISPREAPTRIAQARQLKGYLTFFDKLLVDYLAQLRGVRDLYSLKKGVKRTWGSGNLTGIAPSLEDDFASEFLVPGAVDGDGSIPSLAESEEQFLARRNRVLDHLLARFAERFADYAAMSFRLSGDRVHTSQELLEAKIGFLEQYPALSRQRGQAANLRPEDAALAWNSDNISGIERRVGRLLGLDERRSRRQDLHCADHFDLLFAVDPAGAAFRVMVRDSENHSLFASAETFPDAPKARAAARRVYAILRETGTVAVDGTGAPPWKFRLVAGTTTLTHNADFPNELEATRAARAVLDRYDELLAQCGEPTDKDPQGGEGLHLIEHILLRPTSNLDPLMSSCVDGDCECGCGDSDPYSFRISVVLPYWPRRNRHMAFRALVERTIREEAPAHVQVKICWIGQQQMSLLDVAFREWLEARAAATPDVPLVRRTTARLIEILQSLTSVYPAATLHDCEVGDLDTPVRLGSTALGIFRRSSP